MISQKLNDQITRIGPGSEAGAVLRRYWQPAALADELARDLPLAVNLLGERLALIRDDDGGLCLAPRQAVADEAPSHSPMRIRSYWPRGRAIRLPNAMASSSPIWAPAIRPLFPISTVSAPPAAMSLPSKVCGSVTGFRRSRSASTPAHASFLHRFLEDEDPDDSYGKQFRDRAAHTNMPMTQVLREYPRPEIRVEETDYGLKIIALRHMENDLTHVRVTNQIFPEAICIPMSREMTITQWHVPIDDETCYWYSMFTSFEKPVNKDLMRAQRLKEHRLPDYAPLKNRANDYHYNPEEQATLTYTGMGLDINVHDQWAVEGMGTIQDRTQEHLGRSDVAIIRYRRMLRKMIAALAEDGGEAQLPMRDPGAAAIKGPLSNDAIATTSEWDRASHAADMERRAACPWDATV